MYPRRPERTLIKVQSETTKDIQEVINLLQEAFSPDVGISRIMESQQGGFHAYISIYEKG